MTNAIKNIFITASALFFAFNMAMACDCPQHPGRITKQKTDSFDIIMRARVVLPFPCSQNTSQTRFEGIELYKGKGVPRIIEITHDCKSACRMPFEKEQEWLLYIHHDTTFSPNAYTVTYCERNRRLFSNLSEDDHTLYNDMSYTEELNWLRSNMLPVYFLEPEEADSVINKDLTIIDQNRNIRFATDRQKIMIVLGSFLFMVVIILIAKRFLK